MTTGQVGAGRGWLRLSRAYLTDDARRPLNLVLLAVVPLGFVTLSAGAIADFADVLGGAADVTAIESATAGWAASLLSGVAAFFHVSTSRSPDRRLAAAGSGASRVVAARLASAAVLALVTVAAALLALAVRTEIAAPVRVAGATMLMALVYLGLGTALGAVVSSEINGSLLIVFVWMIDVFFGPAMGGEGPLVNTFPLHSATLLATGGLSDDRDWMGQLWLAAAWAVTAVGMGAAALAATTRPASVRTHRAHSGLRRATTALRYGLRDYRRNPVLWVLLAALPVLFITLSIAVTPDSPAPVELVERGARSLRVLSMQTLHGAIMVPITVGFLAGLAGLFVGLGSADADRRLILSGFRPVEVLVGRLGVIAGAVLLVSAVTLGVTALSFDPQSWVVFTTATLMVAATYSMIGVVVGPYTGLLGGIYLMLALPFVDIGIAQNAMFDAAPPSWGRLMPANGAVRVLLDGAFTATFDEASGLLLAASWLTILAILAGVQFHRLAAPRQ